MKKILTQREQVKIFFMRVEYEGCWYAYRSKKLNFIIIENFLCTFACETFDLRLHYNSTKIMKINFLIVSSPLWTVGGDILWHLMWMTTKEELKLRRDWRKVGDRGLQYYKYWISKILEYDMMKIRKEIVNTMSSSSSIFQKKTIVKEISTQIGF